MPPHVGIVERCIGIMPGCRTKSRYKSQNIAREAAKKQEKTQEGLKLWTYWCKQHDCYHLTSKAPQRKYVQKNKGVNEVEGYMKTAAVCKLFGISDTNLHNAADSNGLPIRREKRGGEYQFHAGDVVSHHERNGGVGRRYLPEMAEELGCTYNQLSSAIGRGVLPHRKFFGKVYLTMDDVKDFEFKQTVKQLKLDEPGHVYNFGGGIESVLILPDEEPKTQSVCENFEPPKPKTTIKDLIVMLVQEDNLDLAKTLIEAAQVAR